MTDLTPRGATGESANVQGAVLGGSEDGSYLYFVADGVLENAGVPVPGAVRGTCGNSFASPASLECNLYVRHDGTPKLIAVLSGADEPDWSEDLTHLTARVSPDGEWAAFMSNRSLTGYDNSDAVHNVADEEVYEYDATTGRTSCASCNPTAPARKATT